MARVENTGVQGARREPLLYQDSGPAPTVKTALEKRAAPAEGKDLSIVRLAREKYWAQPGVSEHTLLAPSLPDTFEKRPDAREMAALLKGVVERHSPRTATSEGERRLLLVLNELVKAQDGVLTRLAKMTKV